MVKFMVFIVRNPAMSPEAFERHFREIHGPLALALPGLVGYCQNMVRRDEQTSPGFGPCDAVAELWFKDRAALDGVWDTPEGEAAVADNPLFMDVGRSHWTVIEEFRELGGESAPTN
jgi:uncharacterized protein (TIGR02118 family)